MPTTTITRPPIYSGTRLVAHRALQLLCSKDNRVSEQAIFVSRPDFSAPEYKDLLFLLVDPDMYHDFCVEVRRWRMSWQHIVFLMLGVDIPSRSKTPERGSSFFERLPLHIREVSERGGTNYVIDGRQLAIGLLPNVDDLRHVFGHLPGATPQLHLPRCVGNGALSGFDLMQYMLGGAGVNMQA